MVIAGTVAREPARYYVFAEWINRGDRLYHMVAGRLSSIDVENLSRHKPSTI